jgi:hypothetical protein
MQSQSAEEAVNAKQSFEDYESHGVEVKHYHADNGILHPNHGRIIAANATKECHTPE